ncbi:replication protein P [Providencia huaxiensis]|uniref:replication protein P n=1 Tax=Providencia TaxID=586 RepID=UPI000ECE3AB1|nr:MULTISPECIES: replication protein P [Providencia]HCI96790.1 DNA replication protein [Providencia sp.]EJD6371454.1 DNA replication protein [Providencia rettgeri]ELR5226596.1 DNA replication protein [Providencia rettgeri]ELR5260012.1 DNA replication protein [Providencia rettgeri]ELT5688917.1 DNA replication protein [Providencia rettgeri]
MKSLVTAIQQRDSTALQAMAAHAPPQQKQAVKQQVAQVFNELFRQLKATFPAAIANFKEQSDLDEFKRQWTIAFIENGIRTLEQINIGMKIARQQTNPFLPSPGQFVQWCKQGDYTALGLPTDDDLFDMFKEYCSVRGWRRFNWQSNACYWMVTKIYSEMRSRNLSDSEVRKLCSSELNAMAKRIKSGEKIPDPMLQLESAVIPTKRDKALSIIAELKNKHGFK